MTPRALIHRRAEVRFVDVAIADREEFALALLIQGYSIDRALDMALRELKDNDGALQMLARHRIAATSPG